MSELLVERDGAIAVVTINRPERRNALTHALVAQLTEAIRAMGDDSRVRAIVLSGAGDRAFSAGADLHAGGAAGIGADVVLRRYYNPLILTMVELTTPIVAAVNGVAAGAAVSLALACDLRVAASSARFQLSFVGVGLVPDAGATWLLPRAIGKARSSEMALLGRPVEADEALAWGLVNRVVPDADLLPTARAVACQLAAGASSVGTTKRLLHTSTEHDLASQLEEEASAQGKAQRGTDYAEARRAFAEKRSPIFQRSE